MVNQTELYSSMARFSADMYSQVLLAEPMEPQNVFVSPLSVYVALLMTLVGAGNHTRAELRKSLHIPQHLADAQTHTMYGSMLKNQFKQSDHVNASMANRLFLLQKITVLDKFNKTLDNAYTAKTEMMNEYANTDAKRQRINQWVSENTNSKIPELIADDVLSDDSILALVNAVYFKGTWLRTFDKDMTTSGSFCRLDGSLVEVPMMTMNENFPYEDLPDMDASAIKIPFGDCNWEMLIVLPNEKDGICDLLQQFQDTDTLEALLAKPFLTMNVEIGLPRFKLSKSTPLDMKTLLQKMGLKSLFSQSADLSNFSSQRNIFVSDFVHKALIEVNEEGAEAAGGSGVIGGRMRPMEFHVDHPFMLALVYNSTLPAFIGHVTDPELI